MVEKIRMLVCDVDPDSRVNTRKAAQRAQIEIVGEVGYGMEAVTFAKSSGPDVILVSVEEPAPRALETAEALANVLPDTPILICSSDSRPEAIRRALVLGARDYILKPLQAQQLREAIDTVLVQDKRRQMRRTGQIPESEVRGMVITVTGGKGGIGKSVTSINLALALRRETGRRDRQVGGDCGRRHPFWRRGDAYGPARRDAEPGEPAVGAGPGAAA